MPGTLLNTVCVISLNPSIVTQCRCRWGNWGTEPDRRQWQAEELRQWKKIETEACYGCFHFYCIFLGLIPYLFCWPVENKGHYIVLATRIPQVFTRGSISLCGSKDKISSGNSTPWHWPHGATKQIGHIRNSQKLLWVVKRDFNKLSMLYLRDLQWTFPNCAIPIANTLAKILGPNFR